MPAPVPPIVNAPLPESGSGPLRLSDLASAPLRYTRTFCSVHATVSSVQELAGSVTLLDTAPPPPTQTSLRFAPMPRAQPSPAGSPWATRPACWPFARRLGFTHSSTEPLVAATVAVIFEPAASPAP